MKKAILAVMLGVTMVLAACGGAASGSDAAAASASAASAGSVAAPETEAPAEEAVSAASETVDAEEEVVEEVESEEETAEAGHFSFPTEEVEFNDGVMTIRLYDGGNVDGFSWGIYEGDKGDASFAELLTQSTMEEGLDYAGSFRAIPDGGDGDDYIRLVYSNGIVTMAYYDFFITVADGAIQEDYYTETTMTVYDEDYLPKIEGTWNEEGGSSYMNISLCEEGGFNVVIYDDTAESETEVYTFHAYNDAIMGCMIYADGAGQTVSAAGEAGTAPIGGGSGSGVLLAEDSEDLESVVSLTWYDRTDGHKDIRFVR